MKSFVFIAATALLTSMSVIHFSESVLADDDILRSIQVKGRVDAGLSVELEVNKTSISDSRFCSKPVREYGSWGAVLRDDPAESYATLSPRIEKQNFSFSPVKLIGGRIGLCGSGVFTKSLALKISKVVGDQYRSQTYQKQVYINFEEPMTYSGLVRRTFHEGKMQKVRERLSGDGKTFNATVNCTFKPGSNPTNGDLSCQLEGSQSLLVAGDGDKIVNFDVKFSE